MSKTPIFKTEPWPHQLDAYNFAIDKPAVGLFMDMGTGKSKVAIDLIVNRGHQKTLIVCPKRAIRVWPKQFHLHSDGINVVPLIRGTGAKKAATIKNYKGPFPVAFITNYDMIWRKDMIPAILGYGFDFVALDESHRIKKPGGKASLFCKRLGAVTPWKALLTGTPMAHSPMDIYGQYRFLAPHIFGTNHGKMESRYVRKGGFQGREILEHINQEELSDKIYDIAFRVLSDVLDIPISVPPIEYEFELPPNVMTIYNMVEKESVLQTEGGLVAINNTLVQYTRMHQLTSGITQDFDGNEIRIDSSKAELISDVLEDLPIEEPLVIFARFSPDLVIIRETCKKQGRSYTEVSGISDGLVDWQEGKYDVIGVQIQSGSEGEDYTRSRYAIYYSLGFSLKDYLQSRKRIDRPGQTRPPIFIHLLAENTIDRLIMNAIIARKEIVDYVTDVYQNNKKEQEYE